MQHSDYLVVGAGATALAFVDTVFHETDATFTIVDRRDAPGGHWNDAYGFVKLHQPSHMYGAASLPFGSLAVETDGLNHGLAPLATGRQVANHFWELMYDTLLPSGRVRYLPLTEYRGEGTCVSLLSGETTQVCATTVVDATMIEATIPLTHQRSFEVAPDAVCIPPNHLAQVAPQHQHYAVLGAGKTALDVVIWLLENGARPDQLTWVRPREAWLYPRSLFQPGRAFMGSVTEALSRQFEAIANAESMEDLALRLERGGIFCRIDPDVTPQMFHGATVSEAELALVRQVRDVVRAGHVKLVEADQLVLEGGTHAVPPGTLVVDCTASGLSKNVGVVEPVFTPGHISLQMVRQYQPTFSAALIGHIETTVADSAERERLTGVTPMTDNVRDWAAGQLTNLTNQVAWMSNPDVQDWVAGCRLNLAASWNDPEIPVGERDAAIKNFRAHMPAALQNLPRLLAE